MKKSYNDILAEIILEEKKKEKRRQKRLKTLEPKSSKKEIKTEKTQELKAIEEQFKEIEVNIKINMKKILSSGKLFNIILTGTGLGKTLGFAIWICQEILSDNDKVFIWIRRSESEIKNTVVGLFKELLGTQAKITKAGVFLDGKQVVYFIPLSLYFHYKSLTAIANKLQAIIFDEAIPVNKKWLDDNASTEEEKFIKLTNILTRNKNIPFYFLCNANAKGTWFIQKWVPNYKPSSEVEKSESKENVFIYSMPWAKGKERGVIDLLENIEQKKTTKEGLFPESENLFITNKQTAQYLYSFVIAGREFEFGRNRNNFIISEAKRERRIKKIIVFRKSDLIVYKDSILGDKNWYSDWWYNLLASQRVRFNSYSLRDHFINKTSQDFRW